MNDFKIIQTFAFLLISLSIQAQFSAGLKLDLISNDVKVSSGTIDLQNVVQSKAGFKTGAALSYNMTENFLLESGLSYNQLGFQVAQNTSLDVFGLNVPLGATFDTRVNYLEIPLLAKYSFDVGLVQMYIASGPSINYAINGRVRTIANSILDFNILDRKIDFNNNRFSRTNVSANLEVGVNQMLTDEVSLAAGLKFTGDLSSSVEVPIVDAQIRNQNFGLSMKLMKKF